MTVPPQAMWWVRQGTYRRVRTRVSTCAGPVPVPMSTTCSTSAAEPRSAGAVRPPAAQARAPRRPVAQGRTRARMWTAVIDPVRAAGHRTQDPATRPVVARGREEAVVLAVVRALGLELRHSGCVKAAVRGTPSRHGSPLATRAQTRTAALGQTRAQARTRTQTRAGALGQTATRARAQARAQAQAQARARAQARACAWAQVVVPGAARAQAWEPIQPQERVRTGERVPVSARMADLVASAAGGRIRGLGREALWARRPVWGWAVRRIVSGTRAGGMRVCGCWGRTSVSRRR
jgi:colicin import membrane protein